MLAWAGGPCEQGMRQPAWGGAGGVDGGGALSERLGIGAAVSEARCGSRRRRPFVFATWRPCPSAFLAEC
eukprot:6194311-Pleurochrysis_carterae.AAC.1